MAHQFDIVIPSYGSGRLTELCVRCLQTIREHSEDYRVILVDNGSPEPGPVLEELQHHPHLYIRNTENVGFIRATNQGIKVSCAPYIILLNNDTEAIPGWLPRLRAAFDVHKLIGLAGPLTTTPESWQGKWPPRPGVHILGGGRMLAFFCVMVKREVFDKIGMLDENYGPGLGDDDDLSRRAERAGFLLALVQDLRIPHHHRSTFRALYTEAQIKKMQDEAMAKFRSEA